MDKTGDKLTREELAELRASLFNPEPVVRASEVAKALGCSKSAVSKFLSGHAKGLPGGAGPRTFSATVARIRAIKESAEAAA